MKTAKEIITAIETTREEERKSRVNLAIELMEAATETMFNKLMKFCQLDIDSTNVYEFTEALEETEVKEWLHKNGFIVGQTEFYYYLKVKEE